MKILAYRLFRKFSHLRGDARRKVYWGNRIASELALNATSRYFNDDIPPAVLVEICTDCNYKCPFCPQSQIKRPSQFMTREDYLVLLRRCREAGVRWLCLFVNNEPFMHPEILEFCRIASEQYGEIYVEVTSNGALITEEHIAFLATLNPPPRLFVNDYSPGKKIVERLKKIISNIDPQSKLTVTFNDRSWTEAHKSNRAGALKTEKAHPEDYNDIFCTWPFVGVCVKPDLSTFLCCSDFRYETDLGNLKSTSLMDIWKNKYGEFRKRLLKTQRHGLFPCSNCDAEWLCLPGHVEKGQSSSA